LLTYRAINNTKQAVTHGSRHKG